MNHSPSPGDRSMLLLELYQIDMQSRLWLRFWQLTLESFVLMSFALLLVMLLEFPNGGMIALFFCSASLLERHHAILDENRAMIWEQNKPGWQANSITAVSIFALFTGIYCAYMVCSGYLLFTGKDSTFQSFFALMLNHFIAYHHLSHLKDITTTLNLVLAGNFLLIGVLMFMGLLFRVYGLVLALGWVAYAWAIEWVRIFQALNLSEGFFAKTNLLLLLRAGLVTLPYMVFEVMAFVLSALAGVFLSRAITLYPLRSARFMRVFRAYWLFLGTACALVLVACSFEVGLPALLKLWKR